MRLPSMRLQLTPARSPFSISRPVPSILGLAHVVRSRGLDIHPRVRCSARCGEVSTTSLEMNPSTAHRAQTRNDCRSIAPTGRHVNPTFATRQQTSTASNTEQATRRGLNSRRGKQRLPLLHRGERHAYPDDPSHSGPRQSRSAAVVVRARWRTAWGGIDFRVPSSAPTETASYCLQRYASPALRHEWGTRPPRPSLQPSGRSAGASLSWTPILVIP